MIAGLRRRASALAVDPTLRRWMLARLAGRVRAPNLSQRSPPYLNGVVARSAVAPESFSALEAKPPLRAIVLPLPGEAVRVVPGEEDSVFRRRFADIETLLALHRFAWIPALGETLDPDWVAALWRGWMRTSFTPQQGWAWHPYTAAERVINILDFARAHGMPADAPDALLAHGPAIVGSLEYFGEGYTSNHLANDGRGLFELGLALGDATSADIGGQILVEEAKRIFLPSGVLREGSTHYHTLLARNYARAAWRARERKRPEADALSEIAERALGVVPPFTLPGGMPLIGDISPDVRPVDLNVDSARPADREALLRDGWARLDAQGWSMLTYASPDGFPPLPGHGHQDMGSFELHRGTEVVICDPGRGTYMHARDASAAAQNGISIDGADPYPTNRAHYDDAFRRKVAGAPPILHIGAEEISVAHDGFARLPDIGRVTRRWCLGSGAVTVEDEIAGRGMHSVVRRLHTTLPAGRLRLRGDGDMLSGDAVCWTAYGESVPATRIEFRARVALPKKLSIEIAL
jgi:hypothetical protein